MSNQESGQLFGPREDFGHNLERNRNDIDVQSEHILPDDFDIDVEPNDAKSSSVESCERMQVHHNAADIETASNNVND